MTLFDLTQPLADANLVAELAKESGLAEPQVRKLLGLLADVPIRQAVRICATARRDRIRQINRETRKAQGR